MAFSISWLLICATFAHSADDNCPTNLDLGFNANKYIVGTLPDVSFDLPTSCAGILPIPNTTTNGLFPSLFEAEARAQREDLISKASWVLAMLCYTTNSPQR